MQKRLIMSLFFSILFVEPLVAAECKSDAIMVGDLKTISALYTNIDKIITSWLQQREATITKAFTDLQNPLISTFMNSDQTSIILEQQRMLTVLKDMQVKRQADQALLQLLSTALNEQQSMINSEDKFVSDS